LCKGKVMEENENIVEELKKIYSSKDKKKKKFVYLDKYETYKDQTDEKIRLMEKSINLCYILIGGLIAAIIAIALIK